MAYNNSEPTETEGFQSKYNEAFLKMHRFHKLQDSINLASMNPLEININLNIYNYQIIIESINSLLKECWSKLNESDRAEALGRKVAIEYLLKKCPIHTFPKNQTNSKGMSKLNQANWELLQKWLFNYETFVRDLVGKTGYDSPNKDEFDIYQL